MIVEPRNGASIDRVYLHKNEGPEQEGGAVGLAAYLDTIQGGYQKIRDDRVTVTKAGDDTIVWGEGGDNTHALAICMVGWSAETAAQYGTDAYSQAEIEGTAHEVAIWCKAYAVPVFHVQPGAPGQAPTERGIAEHADDHDPASMGHTDPGVGFNIAGFVTRVAQILAPVIDWPAVIKLVEWQRRVTATPLHFGDRGDDVSVMVDLLVHRGYMTADTGELYGIRPAEAVHFLKVVRGLPNRDGLVFGGEAAHAPLT